MSQSSEVPEGEFQVQLNWGPFEFLYLQHLPLDGGCTCSGGGGGVQRQNSQGYNGVQGSELEVGERRWSHFLLESF